MVNNYIPVAFIGENSFAYCKVGEYCEHLPKALPQTDYTQTIVLFGLIGFFVIGGIKLRGWLKSPDKFIRS